MVNFPLQLVLSEVVVVVDFFFTDNLPRDTAFKRQKYAFSVGLYFGTDEANQIGICFFSSRFERKDVL